MSIYLIQTELVGNPFHNRMDAAILDFVSNKSRAEWLLQNYLAACLLADCQRATFKIRYQESQRIVRWTHDGVDFVAIDCDTFGHGYGPVFRRHDGLFYWYRVSNPDDFSPRKAKRRHQPPIGGKNA